MTTIEKNINQLEHELRKLRTENKRLQDQLDNKKVGLSDDAVDGIVALTVIGVIVIGVVFWLHAMPS